MVSQWKAQHFPGIVPRLLMSSLLTCTEGVPTVLTTVAEVIRRRAQRRYAAEVIRRRAQRRYAELYGQVHRNQNEADCEWSF
jgi:hypothetical protein